MRPLAEVGRESLTYYVSHLSVTMLAVDNLSRVGVRSPYWLLGAVVAPALGAGRLLVRLRRHRLVDAWFALPAGSSRARWEPGRQGR